ncbi:MAG TPA: hypothetical protein P5567_08340 [Kiritimatiellia bacterium]|nr:hypothetical protein [Kiritimatiellia bacterium]HRZ12449.1 hypothetical protein [Kiritimatiellia bacterium]HSA17793.1 hypothetical protein [Kiritimatiellia bacterium]
MNPDRQRMNRAIDGFVEAHYYSEAPEFESARRGFVDSLCDGLHDLYRQTVLDRLRADPSLVNVLLCAGGDIPGAGPWLAARLDGETGTSPLSRALIRVLADYPGEEACRAVERFLESDQQAEALQALARLDWPRVLPRLVAAFEKASLHPTILHILHARRKAAGLPTLIEDLRRGAATWPGWDAEGWQRVFSGTPAPYNPFHPDELAVLIKAVRPA